MSVKVAVRVRPFNSRQRKLGCQCIVDMQDPSTLLKAYQGQQERRFTFDYSFWSFDDFQEQQDGYLKPTSSKYADQKQVFEKIGKSILDNAWEGYHCCLFAYGQTGSGKSYSMIGYGVNKGIVPITCNQIFQRIKLKKQNQEFEVFASMLQIYNQQIQDLTIPISSRPRGGYKIRQNKLLGVYVDKVKKHRVTSFSEIENVMEQGTKNRTVAATQMNATSSRAHTIITIEFKQIQKSGQGKSEKISMINLVDLAGSQRQDKTGATGQRLKEAVGINQSLTTLGQVISILADNSEGANKYVPYRNSSLTRILQNALGGNSQTIMICAISPASDNYDESLSTLRYADRAKKIKNKPVVNESESDKMIRQLREQNERLQKLLQGKGISTTGGEGKGQNVAQIDDSQIKKRQEQVKKKQQEMRKKEEQQAAKLKMLEEQLAKKDAEKQAILKEKALEIAALQQKLKNEQIEEGQKQKLATELEEKKKQDQDIRNKILQQQNTLNQQQLEQKKILEQQQLMMKKNQQDYQKFKEEVERQRASMNSIPEDNTDDGDQEDIKANLLQLQKLLNEMKMSAEQKKKESQEDQEKMKKQNNSSNILNQKDLKQKQKNGSLPPYLQNISKDVMINRKMKIMLDKSVLTVGKVGCNPPNDILFGGRDVTMRHATIHVVQGKVFLKPTTNHSHLYVNGKRVTDTVQLTNLDRVIFGWNSCYLFKNKHDGRTDEKIRDRDINWQFVGRQVEHLVDIDQSDSEDGGGCCRIF